MRGRWVRTGFLAVGLMLVLFAGLSLAQGRMPRDGAPAAALGSPDTAARAPLGTGFTYQGRLEGKAGPVSSTCEMAFALYDRAAGGGQVGTTITTTVPVGDGLFSVGLDFGDGAFDGQARWLGIQVQCPGDAVSADLGRQELTAAPQALYALKAPWSGLSGLPAGFADGVDGVEYRNVVVVARSGGDYSSIQAALDSITDAGGANRYLVWVAPGTYSETVWMKPYVDIQGAGESLTTIRSEKCGTATVNGADNAELRLLTARQTVVGGCADATAILNDSASPRLTQVTATASGGRDNNFAVRNQFGSPAMTHVTASASGESGDDWGVYNYSASPTMTDVTASASGGGGNCGVMNHTSVLTMTHVTASAVGGSGPNSGVYNESSSVLMMDGTASASGASESTGMHNNNSTATMAGVTLSASGASSANWGMRSFASTVTIRNCAVTVGGSVGERVGVYNYAPSGVYTTTVNNSQIQADTITIKYDGGYTVLVGASQLAGGPVGGDGTLICAGVYDEAYAFYPGPACP